MMNDIRTSGKRPEQETWELLIEACVVCGRWECAVEIVADMLAEEVRVAASGRAERVRASAVLCRRSVVLGGVARVGLLGGCMRVTLEVLCVNQALVTVSMVLF